MQRVDGCIAVLGVGAGKIPLEVLLAERERRDVVSGVDLFKMIDIAEHLIVAMIDDLVRIVRDSLTLGSVPSLLSYFQNRLDGNAIG